MPLSLSHPGRNPGRTSTRAQAVRRRGRCAGRSGYHREGHGIREPRPSGARGRVGLAVPGTPTSGPPAPPAARRLRRAVRVRRGNRRGPPRPLPLSHRAVTVTVLTVTPHGAVERSRSESDHITAESYCGPGHVIVMTRIIISHGDHSAY
jgi:hypothetical protein